mgnify:FL=1|jgi:hypothetical protein|tara:strand:- start:78 stop:650 length:573 start_codon:yes stop_codon:yes gene_type:complete
MANKNGQGFGLIPAGRLGGGPSIQGQGKYKIDAGHSTTIYNGECVKISSGYVVGGNGSAADILGVLNGIFFNAATTLKPTFSNFYKATITPANSEDTTAFVVDDPYQQYVVAADDATGVATMLETYDMNTTAGSDITGKSSSTLDIGTTSANGKQFRMLRSAEDPENEDSSLALASVVVVSNLNSFNGHN